MRRIALSLPLLLALLLSACGSGTETATPESGGGDGGGDGVCAKTKATDDLLAKICDSGTLTVSTDPKYPPQSSFDKDKETYVGFDIDVATEIAERLGVDVAWETPGWSIITAGQWNGRWDLSVGSMTPTNERQKVLHFSQPYYYTPAVVVVHEENTDIKDISTDLDGKKIGVCSGCTYDAYLNKTLKIKGYKFDFVVDDAEVSGYDTDTTALQDLNIGDGTRLDAVITSLTTAQGWNDAGNPTKIVGDPVFYEPLAVAMDKESSLDPMSLVKAVDSIVGEMHKDGTLTKLSKKWYDGVDLTKRR
jgi:polar amino acid transport system substrate-binding protein